MAERPHGVLPNSICKIVNVAFVSYPMGDFMKSIRFIVRSLETPIGDFIGISVLVALQPE